MTLGPKDIVGTIAAAMAGYLGWLAWAGAAYPWQLNDRWAMAALLAVGLTSCMAFSANRPPAMNNPLVMIITTLGGLAFGLAVIGLIRPSSTMVALTAAVVVLIWLLTTVRHLFTRSISYGLPR